MATYYWKHPDQFWSHPRDFGTLMEMVQAANCEQTIQNTVANKSSVVMGVKQNGKLA